MQWKLSDYRGTSSVRGTQIYDKIYPIKRGNDFKNGFITQMLKHDRQPHSKSSIDCLKLSGEMGDFVGLH